MAKKNKRKQRHQQGSADASFGRQQSQQMSPSRQPSHQMGQPRQPDRDSPRKQFQQQNRRGRGQQH